jgi:hypothetical protein
MNRVVSNAHSDRSIELGTCQVKNVRISGVKWVKWICWGALGALGAFVMACSSESSGHNGSGGSHGVSTGGTTGTPAKGCTNPPELVARSVSIGGNSYTCAVLTDGTVRCWGNPSVTQLGSVTDTTIPAVVPGITSAAAIVTGSANCALLNAGTVQCWGCGTYGGLGNGATTDSSVPVTVSGF